MRPTTAINNNVFDFQALDGELIVTRMLGLAELGVLILLIELGEGYRAAVHRGGHASRGRAIAGRTEQQKKGSSKSSTHGDGSFILTASLAIELDTRVGCAQKRHDLKIGPVESLVSIGGRIVQADGCAYIS